MVEDVEMGMKAFEEEYDHFDASATVRVYLKTYPSAFFVAVLIETKGTVNSEKIVGLIGAPILCNTAFIGNVGFVKNFLLKCNICLQVCMAFYLNTVVWA